MALAIGVASVLVTFSVTERTASAATDPAVWIGSPITGRWADAQDCTGRTYPTPYCSLPTVHHTPFLGTRAWSVDLQTTGGEVRLYAAPQNTALDTRIQAKRLSVGPACSSGNLSQGGQQVTIGIYLDKQRLIGKVVFAHVNVASSIVNDADGWIKRYDTLIGTVGSYTSNGCWSGVHQHLEVVSANTNTYSCYNKGYVASTTPWKSTAISRSNFVGFIGGIYSGPRKGCP
jgi:hypothetical protein